MKCNKKSGEEDDDIYGLKNIKMRLKGKAGACCCDLVCVCSAVSVGFSFFLISRYGNAKPVQLGRLVSCRRPCAWRIIHRFIPRHHSPSRPAGYTHTRRAIFFFFFFSRL